MNDHWVHLGRTKITAPKVTLNEPTYWFGDEQVTKERWEQMQTALASFEDASGYRVELNHDEWLPGGFEAFMAGTLLGSSVMLVLSLIWWWLI